MTLTGGPLGLLTDLYELRMAQTYLHAGMTSEATFTAYIRPARQRPWFVMAGASAALDALDRFRYGPDEVDYLEQQVDLADDFIGWLAELEVTGSAVAVPDGTVVLGDEPLLEFTAPLPVAQLLETLLMNVVHFSTMIATKAARCAVAADGRPLADFGARRAHGVEAAVEAARAAFVGGVDTTSNVEAGRRHGIPVTGTMAHAFVQAYTDEIEAFRVFADDHPGNSILLVDTYDTIQGVHNAVEVGRELRERGQPLQGIRLDSGDLADLARQSRAILDDAGFEDTKIFASGGLDENEIHRLVQAEGAPIDAFGVGTGLTTSRDYPAGDIVYKLVEYEGVPHAKYSEGKVLLPGAKQLFRTGGPDSDVLGRRDEDLPGERLLVPVWRDGQHRIDPDLDAARDRTAEQLTSLPDAWRRPHGPDEPPTPAISDALADLVERTRRRELDGT